MAPLTLMLKITTSSPINLEKTSKAPGNSNFLTLEAKLAFLRLGSAFIEASILHYFDTEHYTRIETDASGYTIDGILSQLTSEFSHWHLIAFFSKKMIPVETWYKTHNWELLAIFKVFKTWCHYLQGCKFKVYVHTNYNYLYWFINIKSLSSKQVR